MVSTGSKTRELEYLGGNDYRDILATLIMARGQLSGATQGKYDASAVY